MIWTEFWSIPKDSQMRAGSGQCSVNGIMQKMMMNYYYTRRLQPEGKIESIVRTIEAGETQKWKCYYVVNNTDEELFFEYIKVGQINRISLNLHKS